MTDSQKLDLILDKIAELDKKFTSTSVELDKKITNVSVDLNEKITNVSVDLNEKITNVSAELNGKIANISSDVKDLKRKVTQLKVMDEMILDEVERVHTILNKHISDKSVHIA